MNVNERHIEVNHVRSYPSSQIEAEDAKRRGQLALDS